MLDFKFLTYEQCFVESKKLDVLKKYGLSAEKTDFACPGSERKKCDIDGYYLSNCNEEGYGGVLNNNESFFTKSFIDSYSKQHNEFRNYYYNVITYYSTYCYARPVLSYSTICSYSKNLKKIVLNNGVTVVEFGEYPQSKVSNEKYNEIQSIIAFNVSSIKKTGKSYKKNVVATVPYRDYKEVMYENSAIKVYDEYLFPDGNKYVPSNKDALSGNSTWYKVEPIKWLVDEKSDLAISEKLLFKDVPFNSIVLPNPIKFEQSFIKKFMDEVFAKEIISDSLKYNNVVSVNNGIVLNNNLAVNNQTIVFDERINKILNLPITKLEYNIASSLSIGSELADLTMLIADKFLKQTIENASGNDVIYDIKEDLDKLDVQNNSSIFGKFRLSTKIKKNKKILDELNIFLKNKEVSMVKEINELEKLKNILGNCVYRLNEYIKQLEELLKKIEIDIVNNNYAFFENRNPEVIKQVINERLRDFKISLIINYKQYQNINMLLDNYALNISKIFTARNTTIPSLYVEMSIQNGLLVNKDCSNAIDEINNLLVNMVDVNNELLNIDFHCSINNIKSEELTLELRDSIEKIVIDNSYSIDNNNQKVLKKM